MRNINNIIERITDVINWFLGVILTLMLMITFIQVVLRYVFNSPLIWAEEVTLVMLVWFGYLIIAILVKEDNHISLEVFYLKLNRNLRKILDVVKHVLLLGFSILMVYFSVEMVINAQGKYLPASQINRAMLYIPLAVSGILIVLYTSSHLFKLFVTSEERKD